MRQIYLSGKNEKDKFFIVDDEDYDRLKKYNFFRGNDKYCVHIHGKRKNIPASRLVLNELDDTIIEYRNGDRSDLRKENLIAHKNVIIEEKENYLILTFEKGIGLLDIEYKELILKYRWNISLSGYVKCSSYENTGKIFLHELILKPREGYFTDHINGNRADNRRCNLREVTYAQNKMNSKLSKSNKFGFKGVTTHGGRIIAQIGTTPLGSKRRYYGLGYFHTKEDAAIVYNKAARLLFGEFARLNDIEDVPFVLTTKGKKIDEEYLKTILPINQ